MAWVCKNCNSDNDDSLTACELCGCTEKLVIESHKSILMRKQALELDVVSGVVIVPSAYNIIGAHAFEGNNNIKTVVLHDEVISIYKQAFKDCVNLEKVVCEGMLDSIGPEAFRNCRALKIKPVAKSVDKSAFETDSLFMAEGSVPSRTSTMTPSITTTPIRSGVTSYEDTTRHTSYHFDLETLVKTLAVVIPIIAFIVGQALQYYWLFIKNKIYFLDMFFSAVPATVLYVSSAFCLVSTIHVIIRSWKLADDDELGLGALYFSFSSLFLGGIAPVAGYVGIIVTSAISWLCVTFNEEKVPALLLFLSCAVGLTFMWLSYNRDVNIFLFTKFMRLIDADPFRVMIYLSVATGVSIVASAVMAVGMAYFPNPTVGYGSLGVFCSLMAIVPAIAIPGLLIYAIVFAIISKNEDEHVAKVGAIAVVVVFLITVGGLGVFCGVGKQKTYTLSDYEIVSISSFQDFRQYLNEEVIAMNISKVSESDVATIITGENCKTLVLVSDHNKKFSLTIKTSAKKIILSDVNINYGGLVLDAEKVEIKLYGRNSIMGETGKSGTTGKDGEDGKAAIIGKDITFTGKGRITLIAGNGGTGGVGEKGSKGSFTGSGGKGGTGGQGGNSGYTIDCEYVEANYFSGKITLKKGYAGSGGDGGPGGDGGFFGWSGQKGDRGERGEVADYCSGKLIIDDKRIKKA